MLKSVFVLLLSHGGCVVSIVKYAPVSKFPHTSATAYCNTFSIFPCTTVYVLPAGHTGVAKEAHDPMDMEENYLLQQLNTELSSTFPEIYSE